MNIARSEVIAPAPLLPSAAELRQFRAHPVLARLTDEAFAALFAAARPIRASRGQPLFAVGDVTDAFYLLRSGAVEIVVDDVVGDRQPEAGAHLAGQEALPCRQGGAGRAERLGLPAIRLPVL